MNNTENQYKLLQVLENDKIITSQQVESAKRRMQRAKVSEDKALVELQYCSQADIYKALSKISRIPFVELHKIKISEEAKNLFRPKQQCTINLSL